MRKKIESFTKFIHHERVEGSSYGTFHMEDNPQFIDINNLNQYKLIEIKMIAGRFGKHYSGRGWTKSKMISSILSDKNVIADIKKNNREILLKELVG
jgi:hypothetical protein